MYLSGSKLRDVAGKVRGLSFLLKGKSRWQLTPLVSIEAGNEERDFEWLDGVVDTGFDGELCLTRETIRRLVLAYERLASV